MKSQISLAFLCLANLCIFTTANIIDKSSQTSTNLDSSKTRVHLIGIDGFLQKCMFQANTTNIQKLIKEGSYTFKARTSIEAISAPGWSNLLCGISTQITGVNINEYLPPWIYNNTGNNLTSAYEDKPWPCLFSELKSNNKDLNIKVTSAWDWEWFYNFTNSNTSNHIDKLYNCSGEWPDIADINACDEKVFNKTLDFIKEDFDFMFTYFLSLDDTGHMLTFCGKEYIERISVLDSYIGKILEKHESEKISENTYVMLVFDHGADYQGFEHGTMNNENILIPMFIKGKHIKKNFNIKDIVLNEDVPATILKMFGYEPNRDWRSRAISSAFNNRLKFLERP